MVIELDLDLAPLYVLWHHTPLATPCPDCGARAHEDCTAAGRARFPHPARTEARIEGGR